jgi:hypothetical protein
MIIILGLVILVAADRQAASELPADLPVSANSAANGSRP